GKNRNRGIRMNAAHPEVVTIVENGITEADILVHDINLQDPSVAFMLARMEQPDFPQPVGVFRAVERPSYDQMMADQIETAISKSGPGTLEKLIYSGDMWTVEGGYCRFSIANCRFNTWLWQSNRQLEIGNWQSTMICPSCGYYNIEAVNRCEEYVAHLLSIG